MEYTYMGSKGHSGHASFACCQLPALTSYQLTPSSDMRQVPDNQEVFLSPDSDTSIIIEILAPVDEGGADQDLWEAAT